MKQLFIFLFLLTGFSAAFAQQQPKIDKGANYFVYKVSGYDGDSKRFVQLQKDRYCIYDEKPEGNLIEGYADELTFVEADSVMVTVSYGEEAFYYINALKRDDIAWDTVPMGKGRTKYVCVVNSNKLEFVYQEAGGLNLTPMPGYGAHSGVLVEYWRNGQKNVELAQCSKSKAPMPKFDKEKASRVSPRELSAIKKDQLVVTTRIFDNVQLHWSGKSDHVEGDYRQAMPFDSVLHFAGGTLALKRVKLPKVPSHYQMFLELHQRSNGDAYDRTGSVFVIPDAGRPLVPNFFDGINNHPDSLPIFFGRDGQQYQGVVPGISHMKQYYNSSFMYAPPVELVRFFTPFGVGHYNGRVKIDGLEWRDETYYKQEVTDVAALLQGEVWIGVWIGNYDGGGHIVSLDLKAYPNDYRWNDEAPKTEVRSLFNTCNVLEMAGQNYGKMFGTDSIKSSVNIPQGAKSVRLRFITTGHGGWDGGDEFNPKTNTILVDGRPMFSYTPWRCDCGRYREWNPVSGNFWNGTSSSDYSRSGWCPGTATQPVYFDLSTLEPGNHTIQVAIPQGAPEEGSFSHWSVSGAVLAEY